jgi:hypothetical protein
LKNDANVPSKSNKQKKLYKKLVWKASGRSMMKIAGSGSTPKCHGSATLVFRGLQVQKKFQGVFYLITNFQ